MKQIKEMTGSFKPDKLAPCEAANLKFVPSPKLAQACQQFGEVCARTVSPEKCYATGKGLEIAKVDEPATAIIHIVDDREKACIAPVETVVCELVHATDSVANGKKVKFSIKAKEAGQYEISYKPINRGRQQLHIEVDGEHIKGSPFSVTVKLPVQKLGTPIKIISGVKFPWGVTVNQRGEIIVAEGGGHCISIFSPTGEKLRSFGSQGSGPGQFSSPCGVAVDDDGNILVMDSGNKRIQKFTPNGEFIASDQNKDRYSNQQLGPKIHPIRKIIYASAYNKHCIHILNPDLTFHSSFGNYGVNNGQFGYTYDTAFDSAGNVYVGDRECNNGVQVFTAEGQYLRKFASKGSGQGQVNFPSAIAIDNDDLVYVTEQQNHRVSIFKTDGTFLTTFGTRGNGPGQFNCPNGIAVDKDGFIYVTDYSGRVQIF